MAKEKVEALVPVEEQPYCVPENWQWIRLQAVANLINGDRGINYPSKKDYINFGIPFINAGAIQDGRLDPTEYNYISREKYDSLRSGKTMENDILYCLRGSLGKCAIVFFNEPAAISSSLCILRAKKDLLVKYLFYLLNSEVIAHQQQTEENGSAQPNLSAASVSNYKLPLPPLLEQKRIVNRIESLFAKLDEAKEKAQAVVDGVEDRKAAILHKAYTGELTAKWRKTKKASEWKMHSLDEICLAMKAGGDKPDDFSVVPDETHTIPVIANGVENDGIIGYSTEGKYENGVTVSGRGTIGYSMYRPYPFFPVVRLITLIPVPEIDPEFLKYSFDAFPEKGIGSSIPQLTVPMIKGKMIPVPSFEEQKEVVKEIKRVLDMLQQVKEKATYVISCIDTMKKAILARAFRGELGTDDRSKLPAIIGD